MGLPTPAQPEFGCFTPDRAVFPQHQLLEQAGSALNQLASPVESSSFRNRAERPVRASAATQASNDAIEEDAGDNADEDVTAPVVTAPAGRRRRPRTRRRPYGPRTTRLLSNGERAQFQMLTDYELPDFPLPPGTTCLQILERYPNHLCGQYLEAFIQYFWSPERMEAKTPDVIKEKWYDQAIIKTAKSRPANFIRNRMDTHMEKVLGEAGVRRLIESPKHRPSGLPADEEYGNSDPMRLGLNPLVPPKTTARVPRIRRRAASTLVVQPTALPPVNTGSSVPAPAPFQAASIPSYASIYGPATIPNPLFGIASGSVTVDAPSAAPEATLSQADWERVLVGNGDESAVEEDMAEEGPTDAAASAVNTIMQPAEDPAGAAEPDRDGEGMESFTELLESEFNPFFGE